MSMNKNENYWNSLTVASFIFGLMNYEENVTQGDLQKVMDNSNRVQDEVINRIEQHLLKQDQKIDEILKYLKGGKVNEEDY